MLTPGHIPWVDLFDFSSENPESQILIIELIWQISRVIAVPVFHASAAPVTHVSTLKAGSTAYMMRRFDLQEFLTTVEKYNVTDLAMVPPMVIGIVMSPVTRERPFLKKVRLAACGAAPLDKDLQARFRSLMGDSGPFTQVWGMTETSCIATMFPYPEHDDTGSVGRLIPNLEAKYDFVNFQSKD